MGPHQQQSRRYRRVELVPAHRQLQREDWVGAKHGEIAARSGNAESLAQVSLVVLGLFPLALVPCPVVQQGRVAALSRSLLGRQEDVLAAARVLDEGQRRESHGGFGLGGLPGLWRHTAALVLKRNLGLLGRVAHFQVCPVGRLICSCYLGRGGDNIVVICTKREISVRPNGMVVTRTHEHSDTKLNLHSLKRAANSDLR